MVGFSEMVDDMDALVMDTLADGIGDYLGDETNAPALGITLMIDRNLQQAGADGVFMTSAVGITWRKAQLAASDRGGIFLFKGALYQVEELIADDGYMITAACQVQP